MTNDCTYFGQTTAYDSSVFTGSKLYSMVTKAGMHD